MAEHFLQVCQTLQKLTANQKHGLLTLTSTENLKTTPAAYVQVTEFLSERTTMKKIRDSLTASKAQELCESGGGRPGFPVPNSPCGLCGRKATLNLNRGVSELRSCVKVEVAVLGSPSLIVLTVY